MNKDCLFCQIINRTIPAEIVYEDDFFLAFKDIKPVAKIHLIIIPKMHLNNLNDIITANSEMIGQFALIATQLAQKYHVANSGYRLVTNTGNDAGQSVKHLHFHLLGGNQLGPIATVSH